MHSQSLIWDIMRFEMAMGPSHECNDCGAIFLAHSDGCPTCGSHNISSLHKEVQRERWDMEAFPVQFWDIEKMGFQIVDIGDFSPWPKV